MRSALALAAAVSLSACWLKNSPNHGSNAPPALGIQLSGQSLDHAVALTVGYLDAGGLPQRSILLLPDSVGCPEIEHVWNTHDPSFRGIMVPAVWFGPGRVTSFAMGGATAPIFMDGRGGVVSGFGTVRVVTPGSAGEQSSVDFDLRSDDGASRVTGQVAVLTCK
jgi:hypothetical protein